MTTIKKSKNGRYSARIYVGLNSEGKSVYKKFSGATRTDVVRKVKAWQLDYTEVPCGLTFAVASHRLLLERKGTLSPSTHRAYTFIDRHISEQNRWIYHKELSRFTKKDVQRFVNELMNCGFGVKTIRNYIGYMSAVITGEGYPFPKVHLPNERREEFYIPDEQTMRKVIEASKGTRLEVPIALGVLGMRRSEVVGASIDDLNGCDLHINTATVQDIDLNLVNKGTKTYTSDRHILLPEHIADKIREQGFVTDYKLNALSSAFTRFLRYNGFPHFRFHDLRGYFASYAHNVMHLSDSVIQKIGGWKTNSVMRNHYIHSMETEKAKEDICGKMFG